jgi:aryl-alcohol dehydrogenase-like predicted oxidoreductase
MGRGLEGAGGEYLKSAVAASLDRLQIETIDLYQLHGWDPATPLLESLEAIHGLVADGSIRYFGVSNYTGFQLQKAIRLAEEHGLTPPVSLQPQYSLLSRQIEWELLPQCLEEEIGVLPWSPLGGGWLTGKYRAEAALPDDSRLGDDPNRGVEGVKHRDNANTYAVLAEVETIANRRGVSAAQVALNWVRQRPGVSSVLLGARNTAQLADNLSSLEWELEPVEMDRLTEVSAPGTAVYPYGFIENYCGYRAWEELGTRKTPHEI